MNLEMNVHLEGPIVAAFYDMALLSWAETMDPPMPLLVDPGLASQTSVPERDCFEEARVRKAELDRTAREAIPAHPGTSFHVG